MADRLSEIGALLESAGWGGCRRTPLAGDLSTRRYSRIFKGSFSAILMDADSTMQPYARMTKWLQQVGLSVPKIIAGDPNNGLLLLEDFGDTSVNRHLQDNPNQIDAVHHGVVDLLLTIREARAPELEKPDAAILVDWTRLTDAHYPGTDTAGLSGFRDVLATTLKDALAMPGSVSLRDFHADNLMWLPDRKGTQKFGLLDYQDAFLTHPAYDLASFLTDARVEVTPTRRKETLQMYLDRSGDDESAFRRAFAAFSTQRNLRILGIFAKGAADGRGHHLHKLPRVQGYFADALHHPVFDDVREAALGALPDPAQVIEDLGK